MPVGLGFVGAGYIGKVHARAARATGVATLAAVYNRTEDAAQKLAAEVGIASVARTYEELLANPVVDAVVISVPNSLHAPFALQAFAAGKHVLVEKPMAISTAEAQSMRDAARAADRRLMVGHMWRFDREAQFLRQQIAQGAIGEIVKTKGYGIHVAWGPAGWFTQKSLAGGGALIDMGVHAIDTVRYLMGDPKAVRVYASLSTRFGKYDVDDLGVLMITWDNGAVSIIESGWWNSHSDGEEAATQLFGTTGYARLFPTELNKERPSFTPRSDHCDPHIYEGQLRELVSAIEENREPAASGAHGLEAVRICEAAYASAANGQVVTL